MSQFKKGEGGNTATQFQKGNKMQKPKGYEQAKTIIKRVLATENAENPSISNSEAMIIAMVQKALKGDVQAFNSLYDRVHGKPKTAMELSGDFAAHNLRYSSNEELKAKIAAIDNELKQYDNEEN